jgi:hypothetical protein
MNTEQQQLFHPSFGLGQYQEQVNAKVIPLFRNSDPASSKAASVGASKRRPSQQVVLLKAYAINAIHGHKGLTDEMAGIYSRILQASLDAVIGSVVQNFEPKATSSRPVNIVCQGQMSCRWCVVIRLWDQRF